MGRTSLYRVLSDERILEIWMRKGAERWFDELLEDELGSEELHALKNVFFHHLYRPDFGDRIRE